MVIILGQGGFEGTRDQRPRQTFRSLDQAVNVQEVHDRSSASKSSALLCGVLGSCAIVGVRGTRQPRQFHPVEAEPHTVPA